MHTWLLKTTGGVHTGGAELFDVWKSQPGSLLWLDIEGVGKRVRPKDARTEVWTGRCATWRMPFVCGIHRHSRARANACFSF